MSSQTVKRKNSLIEKHKKRSSQATAELTSRLLDNDHQHQPSPQHQPRSFFNQDEDDAPPATSLSPSQNEQKDAEIPETFDTAGYKWDFVIVLPLLKPDQGKTPKYEPSEIVQLLHKGNLETYLYKSVQDDEIYVKIRASVKTLKNYADFINYRVICDPERLRERIEFGLQTQDGAGYIVKPIRIPHNPTITSLQPYDYIYKDFRADDDILYANAYGLNHPFSSQHRIKLILSILCSPQSENGCGLHLNELVEDGSILAYFPFHERETINLLEAHWLPWRVQPWEQPVDDLKDYFGEKIGLYFEFLGYYTTWLLPLSIAGIIVGLDIIIESAIYDSYAEAVGSGYTIPFFIVFVAIWSQLMLEYWKRTEATKAMEWGTSKYEDEERTRPEFEGSEMTSCINGSKIQYFPPAEQAKRSQHSAFVISGMVLLVIACVAVIFYVKFYMVVQSNDGTVNSMGGITASLANAIQIQVLNAIYQEIAVSLTKRENHRTDTEYEDALIAKLYAFQFVNSYASFFYISYVKTIIGDPCAGTCMSELSIAIATIFGTRLIVGNAQEVLMPLAMGWYKRYQESKASGKEDDANAKPVTKKMSEAEAQYTLETYDPMMGTLEDYAELAIQFGFLTLFVAAFPLGPLLGYLSNVVEIRTDGWKLLHAYRRPVPTGAQDIGTWMAIFQITAGAAVITNAGILCFTMNIFDVRDDLKVWIFIIFQYVIFIAMAIFSYVVDDVPQEVKIQLEREEFIVEQVEKILNKTPDEDDSYLELGHKQGSYRMHIHADDDEPPFSGH